MITRQTAEKDQKHGQSVLEEMHHAHWLLEISDVTGQNGEHLGWFSEAQDAALRAHRISVYSVEEVHTSTMVPLANPISHHPRHLRKCLQFSKWAHSPSQEMAVP